MLEIIDPQLILAVCIAITAAALTSYVGFGGALIMVPLFTILFGPVDAIAITTLCSVLSLSPVVVKIARDVEWSQALPLSIGIIISNMVGVIFLTSADPSFVVFGIGLFVLVSGCILMSGFSYQGPRNRTTSVILGVICGSVMGGFGVPSGPILVVYFLAAPITATAQRANILFPIWVMCLVTASSLFILGEIKNEILLLSCLILPFSLFGAWLGSNIFKKAPVGWFKTLANWLLILIGASLLVNQIFLI